MPGSRSPWSSPRPSSRPPTPPSRLQVTYIREEAAETDLRPALDAGATRRSRASASRTTRAATPRRRWRRRRCAIEQEYATPPQTNNPLGLFATVAAWDGDQLTLYDANQFTRNVAKSAASVLGLLAATTCRCVSPFVGGGFGAGLRAWPHTWLAAMAAREVGRPVKLVLPRTQMFTAVGRRAQTVQHVSPRRRAGRHG